jgi:arylsulfatase A-like enzyme/uncharacterized membrane protein YbhN (UPF0104 family)
MTAFQVFLFSLVAFAASRFVADAWKGRLVNLAKASFTIAAFWALFAHELVDQDGVRQTVWAMIVAVYHNIQPATFWFWVAVATGVKFIGILSSMYRWQLVLRGQEIDLPFKHIFGSFMIGRALGTFLPSTAGLDGYTLYDAARFTGKTVEVSAAKFLEKICGFSGVFLTFLVTLPFGISILGQYAWMAYISALIAVGVIGGLMSVLFYPGLVQWVLLNVPIPAKARLSGIVTRISESAAAYRDKKVLVLQVFAMSFLVHFTTAAMYYYTALAIGAPNAHFWKIAFGSSIQIFATVISPFTIAGEGIREAAHALVLSGQIGAGAAVVSAALGFWAAEAPTMLGFVFWWLRPADYHPEYARVKGVQVDYAAAAKAAVSLDPERSKEDLEAELGAATPMGERLMRSAGFGFGSGVLAGIVIGVAEALVIARGGFVEEAQVLWYGPMLYALFLGGLGTFGGLVLGLFPMDAEETRGWTPTLGFAACLVPLGLFVTIFRLYRDVYLERMPPLPVLLGVVAVAGALGALLVWGGHRFFKSRVGIIARGPIAAGLLVLVCGTGLAFGLGFAPDYTPPSGRIAAKLADKPNIVLIMVDTLRADYLPCYGASDVKAPNICGLAESGGLQLDGFSHASWTKPATASLLTSLVPTTHNAMSKLARLSDEVDLVSEVLQGHGYSTGGVVSNVNLAASWGFDQGYDEYHYLAPSYLAGATESSSKLILYQLYRQVYFKLKSGITFDGFYQDSRVVNEVAFDWLDRFKDDRFFLFVHYMDVHDPYFEHPYDGRGVARVSNKWPNAEEAEDLKRLYRGEIEYLDEAIGELVAHLKSLGVWDDTLVVLTADHGEEFYEHEGWWHGLTLYNEQIHVPLLIKPAVGQPLPEATRMARHIDVVPTLIDVAGAEPPERMQGVSLYVSARDRAAKDRQHFAEEDHEGNVLWSLTDEQMNKLIVANQDHLGEHPKLPEVSLFEIDRDPGETDNLATANAARVETLRELADLQRRAAAGEAVEAGADVEMTLEECQQLMNLGYVEDCSHLH